MSYFIILVLAFFQNVSFTMVSRSRNRSNLTYHMICAVGSNTIWFLCLKELVRRELPFELVIPYVIGTVAGSLAGVRVSMVFERWLGASADGHLKK